MEVFSFVFREQAEKLGISKNRLAYLGTYSPPAKVFCIFTKGMTKLVKPYRLAYNSREISKLAKKVRGKGTIEHKEEMKEALHDYMKEHGSPLSDFEAEKLLKLKMRKNNLNKKDVFGELTDQEISKLPSNSKKILAHNLETFGKLR